MKTLITILFTAYSFGALAQRNEPQEIINEFFKIYKEKGSDAALDYVFKTNKWMDDSKEQIENVKFKLNSSVVKSMGEFFGYDLITKRTVGDKLVHYTYLLRYDRQPIRFSFLFYNPNGKWRLHNFSFDDSIKDDLVESSKAYRLKENLEY